MTAGPIVIKEPIGSRDNEIRPFRIEGESETMSLRGRAIRLGTVIDQILSVHKYPEPVATILGELVIVAGLLGSTLKYSGVVTVQTKSSGAVPMMVADYEVREGTSDRIRAYAQIDDARLNQYGENPSFHGLIGSKAGGYLALTIDQGQDMERYQGIVELTGDSLAEVAANYFVNSEQTPTALKLCCRRDGITGHWRAGGIMVQHLARGEQGKQRIIDRETEEQWNRAQILLGSVKDEELTDPKLDLDHLLYRLYHEDGVRVFDAIHGEFGCRCSRDRIHSVIKTFPDDDIDHMIVDGAISVDCHFCGSKHIFEPNELRSA